MPFVSVARGLPRSMYSLVSLAFVLTFLVTLWMTYYSPVNADEIFWKLMIARLESDEGKLVYLFAQCRQGQWIDAPLTWYPAMFLNSWFYEDASKPWELRLHGWILFIVLLGFWSWLLRRRSGLDWPDSMLAVSAFLSVGVLPFLMVYERPEQPLLLGLTLALLTTLWGERTVPATWPRALLIVLAYALLATLMAGTHPKGLFIFPVLAVLAWRQLHSVGWMVLLLGLMGWTAYDTNQVWQLRTTCPEYPGLMKLLHSLTLRPGLLFSDPVAFMRSAWSNLMAFGAYVTSLDIRDSYVANWLPETAGRLVSDPMIPLANALLWVPLLLAFAVTGWNWLCARRPRGWVNILLWLTILTVLLVTVMLQNVKNFYEAALIWPLVLLVLVFSFGKPLERSQIPKARLVIFVLLSVALISGVLRVERFSEAVPQWREERVDLTEKIDVYNKVLRDFARLHCGIEDSAERLVLDKDTYQAFWDHEQPLFLDYAAGWWAVEADVLQTFRQRRVQGLVAKCERVPEALLPLTRELDGYCCIAEKSLQ